LKRASGEIHNLNPDPVSSFIEEFRFGGRPKIGFLQAFQPRAISSCDAEAILRRNFRRGKELPLEMASFQ
jgi:hypothetical protein